MLLPIGHTLKTLHCFAFDFIIYLLIFWCAKVWERAETQIHKLKNHKQRATILKNATLKITCDKGLKGHFRS